MSGSKRPTVQAGEITYELHSLGWKAFQNLSLTIASEIWGQTVQGFSDSNDGGRDGAFYGNWHPKNSESFTGTFTVQCKFTAKVDGQISLSDLQDELEKAKRLAARGVADNYFLFTNARLKGTSDEKIRELFESVPGIKRFAAFGCERISQIIRESARLRMLVPRVYGLGDLSQILDERAYAQAKQILSALGDDLGKFVITEAYQKSAKAVVEHGFVLLLGEPACGKSTIAAALAVGALDEWGCSTIKIRDADDFVKLWNPNEPKQFFWVDDAFGATQFDWSSAATWNRVFPHIQAAIRLGARVLFTSRDYVYRSARNHLKESALPIMKESQVVIKVENLTPQEREQILYNHIRLGIQTIDFKNQIKPFLSGVAAHEKFSPEIARRLGNPMFTKGLVLSKGGLDNFVGHNKELLLEIIRTLDDENRSTLALVFMRAGMLSSPVEITVSEQRAIDLLGGSLGGIRSALNALKGSLLIQTAESGNYFWRFKHPTIRDAFAALIAEDRELMDIYLAGAPLNKLFGEIACGDVGIEGVKVIVPSDRYETVLKRFESFETVDWHNEAALNRFLAYRCVREFLELFLTRNQNYISRLRVRAYLNAVSDVALIVRLHQFGLLPNSDRLRAINEIRNLAISIPDSGFLNREIRVLMTDLELADILEQVQTRLLPNLGQEIDSWRDNFTGKDDPEEYFSEFKSALQGYRNEFKNSEESVILIDSALTDIDMVVENMRSESLQEMKSDDFYSQPARVSNKNSERSIFDDVDL